MLSSALLAGSLACSKAAEHSATAMLRSQLHSASAIAVAAAAGTSPSLAVGALESNGALTSTLSCSPPRTHTRTSNFTTRLTVPTTALAAAKTRRRRRRSAGGGGDDEIPDGDDGSDGFGGGGDDSSGGGWWGGGEDEGEPEGGSGGPRTVLQDLVLLWSVFCAICFAQTLHHLVRRGARGPPGVLAALTLATLRHRRPAAAGV